MDEAWIEMSQKENQKCPSLVIREMQIKINAVNTYQI
jgi:hypothetical protein